MRRAFGRVGFLLAGLALLLPGEADAQATTSTVRGIVRDATQAVVPGVALTARHLETGLLRSATSDSEGRFVIPTLPLGAYDVRAELQGFRTAVRHGVMLALGEPAEVAFTLEVGGTAEELTVTGALSAVRTRSGELGYLVSEEAVRELPLNGRNFTDLAFLQPGVVAFPHRDGGSAVAHGMAASVNGQDPRSNVYLLDGTLMNDFTNGPAGSVAGTALGTETVREFRVEANAYGAEYGRNAGGQINVITKSGSNELHGSVYEFHRNDALDARNVFDVGEKPDFQRNQFGATVGGPVRRDSTFFFLGYEGLRENLGRTVSSVVPDLNARQGLLPDPARAGNLLQVGVDPAVRPYLNEYPLPNGAALGGGLAAYTFPFDQKLRQNFFQARVDHHFGQRDQLFARYTRDRASQELPTDFPQFPRDFVSYNQYATGEYRRVISQATMATVRGGWSRTRVGQTVSANTSTPLAPFVSGRASFGNIDVGGIPRFGPQSSGNLSLRQQVFSLAGDLVHSRGRHFLKGGFLGERYHSDMENPTFSLGIFTFANLEGLLRNRPVRFIGLTPEAQFERSWRYWLLAGYLQDDIRLFRNVTLNAGLRYEYQPVPEETEGRDISLPDLMARSVTQGPLYENASAHLSPRLGLSWDVRGDGRTAVRGGYGLYYNTNNQQNLIVTVTNPPFTPRPVIANPRFPNPDFSRAGGLSVRPMQHDLETPRMHIFNVGVQQELPLRSVLTVSYAGARGKHLLRNTDANIPTPQVRADGELFFPPTAARPNTAFSAIEIKTSDGESWYDALVVELRRTSVGGLGFQGSYTLSRNEDTTQASTFFSDATNGTVSVMPEFGRDYNRGRADYDAKHNFVFNVIWDLPVAREAQGFSKALFGNWQLAAIGHLRSGSPLTVFVQANRSRSRWSPSIGPGTGFDRPDLVPGRTPEDAVTGNPAAWFDPTAFALQPAGELGTSRRGAFTGPNLRTLDLSLVKRFPWARLGDAGRVELRIEAFNVLNRANYGIPGLVAFAGARDGEAPLPTFGRIRTTVTAARQVQLGARVVF